MAVLAKEVVLRHQGSVVENFFYPSPADSIVSLASATNVYGRVRQAGNSLSLSSISNFVIGITDILHGMSLNVSLTTPANNVISTSGWLYELINRVEVIFPNSQSPTQTMEGRALFEYMLYTCQNERQRRRLIEMGGLPTAAGTQASACIPLWWVLGSAVGLSCNYPLDASTLTGSVQFNITWNSSSYILCRTGAAPTTISSFDSMYLSGNVSELDNPTLSIRNEIATGEFAYPLHGKAVVCVDYYNTFALNVKQSINLQSAPDAGLDAILMRIRPAVEYTANADGTSNYLGSLPVTQLELKQGGKLLFKADNRNEYRSHLRNAFGGDDLYYRYYWDSANSSAAAAQDEIESQVICIPFNLYGKNVASAKLTENMKSYSNAPLQLDFTVTTRTQYDASASPFYPSTLNPRGGAGSQAYQVSIMYVIDVLLDIDRNGVKVIY